MKNALLAVALFAAAAAAAPPASVELWVRADPDGFSSVKAEALGVDLTAVSRSPNAWAFTGRAGAPVSFAVRRERVTEADESVSRWRFEGAGFQWTLERVSRLRSDYRLRPPDGGPSVLFATETASEGPAFRIEADGLDLRTRDSGPRTRVSGTALGLGPSRAAALGAALILLRLDPPRRIGT